MPPGSILIVRHGQGRGRLPGYFQEVLDDIARRRPALSARLRFHRTGEPSPDLTGVRAVVFWLADPLRELYPECYAEAVMLGDEARARGARIVNDPDALSNTIKSVQAERWRDAGLSTPAHWPYTDRRGLSAAATKAAFPVVVRSDWLHAQQHMRICGTRGELESLPHEAIQYPGALAEFVDVRAGYAATSAPPVWSELFHKKRQFVFGPVTRTSHLFFSASPLVSSRTYVFRPQRHEIDWWSRTQARITKQLPRMSVRRRRRIAHRDRSTWHRFELLRAALEEDIRYWERGSERPELMHAAMEALGLDFGAIDYSTLSDGHVILWEANPYVSFPPLAERMLVRERRTRERLVTYHDAVAEFLQLLAAGP